MYADLFNNNKTLYCIAKMNNIQKKKKTGDR